MSVQRKSSSPSASPLGESDLEITAELPVLDVAAYEAAAEAPTGNTDTWIIPSPTALESPSAARPLISDTVVMPALGPMSAAAEAAPSVPTAPVAPVEERRTPLELSLHALSEDLRDVEERLRIKGEHLAQARAAAAAAEARVAELQRALAERETATAASRDHNREFEEKLAQRDKTVARLQKDLIAAQALVSTYLESLRSVEGRRGIFQELSTSLHWEVEERATRLAELEGQLTAGSKRVTELESTIGQRDARIGELERQLDEINATLSQRDTSLRESAVAIEDLKRAAQHTAELEASMGAAKSRGEELDATNAQLRKRIDQLEVELVTVRSELQQRSAALDEAAVARGEHMARIAAEAAHVQELEGRIQEQHEFVRVLQADSNASVARAKELEGDLRAAEDMIHRLEADLRNRNTRLDELEKTQQEWRATVEEARNALTDRDSLIRRLEEETANSAVLLGAIQERLDASGVHEIAPDGDKRLLIRSDGDSEVVHVLGRKTSVGRTPDNDLQIDAKFISRHHAVILAGPAHTIIEDLNSTNGVLVNGRRITRQTLKDGDAVVIGKTAFRFAVRPPAERRA